MFTGIVQGKTSVIEIKEHTTENFRSIWLEFPSEHLDKLSRGASIAINGTCLTVRDFDLDSSTIQFDVIEESLSKTNLGTLKIGSIANFERAAKIGDEIGGHLMSGHISTTVQLIEKISTDANVELVFSKPAQISDYLLDKGFVGLNGCSLTLGNITETTFSVFLIPETLEVTTFGEIEEGELVNLEVDPQTQAIVDTVKKLTITTT